MWSIPKQAPVYIIAGKIYESNSKPNFVNNFVGCKITPLNWVFKRRYSSTLNFTHAENECTLITDFQNLY